MPLFSRTRHPLLLFLARIIITQHLAMPDNAIPSPRRRIRLRKKQVASHQRSAPQISSSSTAMTTTVTSM